MGGFGTPKRISPKRQERSQNLPKLNLGGTSVKPWWNLDGTFHGTFSEPFGSPKRSKTDAPQKTREIMKLVQPWWNLPRNLLAAQDDLPQDQRDIETCATLVKPWRNLGETLVKACCNLPQNLLAAQDGFAPEAQRDHDTGASLVEHWRNLLAAQDGSAPENRRESESDSAPKPLLWLKTPKLLLLGKNPGIS